jgi:hypothetical protein
MIGEMPIHEYTCPLGHTTEEIFANRSNILDAIKCSQCGHRATRDISLSHFEFKNLPKLMDDKHNNRISLMREQLAEKNYMEAKNE